MVVFHKNRKTLSQLLYNLNPNLLVFNHTKTFSILYKAGLHILCEIQSTQKEKTSECAKWQAFIKDRIIHFDLVQVNEAVHQFEGGGYTGVHCLTESHIAVHTWPEYAIVTFDVFLCNYLKENDALVEKLSNEIITFFEGNIIQKHTIKR